MTSQQIILALLSIIPLALVLLFRKSVLVRVLCVLGVAFFVHIEMTAIPGAVARAAMGKEDATASPTYREAVEFMRKRTSSGEAVLGWYVLALAAIALIPLKSKNKDAPTTGFTAYAKPEAAGRNMINSGAGVAPGEP